MQPRIELSAEKILVGKRLQMSLALDKTPELWQNFMIRRQEIPNRTGTEFYSMQLYNEQYFQDFNPANYFEKWAAVEVADLSAVPEGMESFILPGGLYAVFLHKGGPRTGPETFQYIFTTWLPDSEYLLDNRPHFEVLGEQYKNDDPASEEEIWIPVRPKNVKQI